MDVPWPSLTIIFPQVERESIEKEAFWEPGRLSRARPWAGAFKGVTVMTTTMMN